MNLKEIGHTKITPEGWGENIAIAGGSLIGLIILWNYLKSGIALAFFLILLLIFFISLAQILVNIIRLFLAFSRRILNLYLAWKNS